MLWWPHWVQYESTVKPNSPWGGKLMGLSIVLHPKKCHLTLGHLGLLRTTQRRVQPDSQMWKRGLSPGLRESVGEWGGAAEEIVNPACIIILFLLSLGLWRLFHLSGNGGYGDLGDMTSRELSVVPTVLRLGLQESFVRFHPPFSHGSFFVVTGPMWTREVCLLPLWPSQSPYSSVNQEGAWFPHTHLTDTKEAMCPFTLLPLLPHNPMTIGGSWGDSHGLLYWSWEQC